MLGLERAYAFGDSKQPECAGHQQRDADRGRTHVLDLADLWVVFGGEPVRELLDRGIEDLDYQYKGDGGNQFHAAHHARAGGGGQDHDRGADT